MNEGLIFNAWKARVEADQGTGGLCEGGHYSTSGGGLLTDFSPIQAQATQLNFTNGLYIVALAEGTNFDALDADIVKYTMTLQVYAPRNEGMSARLVKVLNRLHGDAMLQAGRIPSYGFSRHTLVLSSDATLNPLGALGGDIQWQTFTTYSETPDVLIATRTYEGSTTAKAVTP